MDPIHSESNQTALDDAPSPNGRFLSIQTAPHLVKIPHFARAAITYNVFGNPSLPLTLRRRLAMVADD
jgi:hypothetical protein